MSQNDKRLLESQAALVGEITNLRSTIRQSSSSNYQHQYHSIIANDNARLILGNFYQFHIIHSRSEAGIAPNSEELVPQHVISPKQNDVHIHDFSQHIFSDVIPRAANLSFDKTGDYEGFPRHPSTRKLRHIENDERSLLGVGRSRDFVPAARPRSVIPRVRGETAASQNTRTDVTNSDTAQHALRVLMQNRPRSSSSHMPNPSAQFRSSTPLQQGQNLGYGEFPAIVIDSDPATLGADADSMGAPSITRCVCNSTSPDDNIMIRCESCQKWLHAECVGLNTRNVHDVYVCVFCEIKH